MRAWWLLILLCACDLDEWPAVPGMIQGTTNIGTISSLTVGGGNSCVVTTGGSLYCWGVNGNGQLGVDPMKTPSSMRGVRNPQVTHAVQAAMHEAGAICIVESDGSVQCLGAGSVLGDGGNMTRVTIGPAAISDATAISGSNGFCAITASGLSCWAAGIPGEPGYNSPTPAAVSGLTGVTAVAEGDAHGCAIAAGGQLWCWGYDTYGELGDGTCSMTTSGATQATGVTATDVAVTEYATCTVAGGAVSCLGAAVPPGTIQCSATPTAVAGITGAQHIVAGEQFLCVLDANGTVSCWGDDSQGQLGTGAGSPNATPTQVPGLSGVALLGAAGSQACAVTTDSKVYCWGQGQPVTQQEFQ